MADVSPELEAVARALYAERKPIGEFWEVEAEYIAMARAALLAIRTPTEGMVWAGAPDGDDNHSFRCGFSRAIDHILGSTSNG